MEFLFLYVLLAILVGVYAGSKGRSGFGYFLLAVLLSPIIAFVILLIAGENRQKAEERKIGSGDFRKCPFCAEFIKVEAVVCKHCGRDLPILKGEPKPTTAIMSKGEVGPSLEDNPKPTAAILSEEEVKSSDDYNWWLIVAGGVVLFVLLVWLT